MKENLKKFIVSFENMILKWWKNSTFSKFLWKIFYFDHQFSTIWKTSSLREFNFFVKKFLFWPSIFNYLKNELTSRIWFFMWKKHFFDEKIFLLKEKKRGKNWIFYWFFEYDPIHNLKEIIKFSKKMSFQLFGGEGGYGNFWYWFRVPNWKGHRLD